MEEKTFSRSTIDESMGFQGALEGIESNRRTSRVSLFEVLLVARYHLLYPRCMNQMYYPLFLHALCTVKRPAKEVLQHWE